MKPALALTLLLLAACSTPPAPLAAPEWDLVPAGVLDSLCSRLQEDAISAIAVVKTTQPIATAEALAALGASSRARTTGDRASAALAPAQKSIPVDLATRACSVTPLDRLDSRRHADLMVVELSAPIANPYSANEAGIFVRVSLGGTHPTWYWLPLGRHGDMWMVGRALPLAM